MRTAALAKTPQAVVKIIGYTKSKSSIKRQIDYISRKGAESIENEAAAQDQGDGLASRVLDEWGDKAEGARAKNGKAERLSMHVQVSMPKGTDPEVFREVARAWGHSVFDGRQFVFAVHDDRAHPHAHFLVPLKDDNGKKMDPRKADLQRWRETFAEIATQQGYPMAATRWWEHRKERPPLENTHTASYRMLERGELSTKLLRGIEAAIGAPAPRIEPEPLRSSREAHRAQAEAYETAGKAALAAAHAREAQAPRRGRSDVVRDEIEGVKKQGSVSPKMLALADVIAKERGVELRPETRESFAELRAFLNEHARRQIGSEKATARGDERGAER